MKRTLFVISVLAFTSCSKETGNSGSAQEILKPGTKIYSVQGSCDQMPESLVVRENHFEFQNGKVLLVGKKGSCLETTEMKAEWLDPSRLRVSKPKALKSCEAGAPVDPDREQIFEFKPEGKFLKVESSSWTGCLWMKLGDA